MKNKHFTPRQPIFLERGGATLGYCSGAGLAVYIFFCSVFSSLVNSTAHEWDAGIPYSGESAGTHTKHPNAGMKALE